MKMKTREHRCANKNKYAFIELMDEQCQSSLLGDQSATSDDYDDYDALRTHLAEIEIKNYSLHQLAREGNVAMLRKSVDNLKCDGGPQYVERCVNALDGDGFSPLHYAARYNHFSIVRLLIDVGADVNIEGEDGVTPLHFASRYRHNDSALSGRQSFAVRTQSTQLMRRSASDTQVDIRDDDDGQILTPNTNTDAHSITLTTGNDRHFETQLEAENIISYLIRMGADPNLCDRYGQTALHYAAMRSNTVAAQELLRTSNVDPMIVDAQGMSPLHTACAHGSSEIVVLLLRNSPSCLKIKDEQNNTPLHLACEEGCLEIVKTLLDHLKGVNKTEKRQFLEAKDYDGNTALHLAVVNRHIKLTQHLLRQGASANTHRRMYNSPLHSACVNGDKQTVAILLNYGALINLRNAEQQTPMHRAAAFNHDQAITNKNSKSKKANYQTDR